MIGNPAGDDLQPEVLEVRSDERVGDGVAAGDELVAGVTDDVGVKVALQLRRIAVVQGLECAVHDECRPYCHLLIVAGVDRGRVGNAS